jgi:gliding motility-associated-like protein
MTIVVNNISGPSITSALSTNNTCHQSGDGTATIQITGGTGPFNYTLNGTTNQSSGTFQNLPAGTATIVVTDNNGCTASNSFVITQPSPLSLTTNSTNSTCGNSNGTINLSAAGGTSPYAFSNNGGLSYQTNPFFAGLNAGVYSTFIEDANGCTASASQTITDLPGPSVASITTSNPACFNSVNGTVTILASGNGPLSFSLNGSSSQQNAVFSGLSGGSYNILVTDTNGCVSYGNALLVEPDPMIALATTNPSICNNSSNGTASVTAQGGATPYTYLWNTGGVSSSLNNIAAGSYTVTITDANGCTLVQQAVVSNISGPNVSNITTTNNSCYQSNDATATVLITSGTGPFNFNLNGTVNQSNGSFNNLPAGPGTVLVTDNNGCTATTSFNITEPGALTISSINSSSTCGNSNATITITAGGGTGPYQFSNNGGGTYQTQNIFQGLGAGSYNLSITDANGCMTNSTEVVSDLAGPIVSSTSFTNPTCFSSTNGSINVVANGNGPLTYSINNGSTTQSNTLFQNLVAGTYNILVTDTNGCTTTTTSTLTQPSILSASTSTTPSYCDGGTNGSITLNAQGGTSPYAYQWSNGFSSASNNNLSSGTYSITITDANGCTLQQTAIVTNVPSPTISGLTTVNNSCYQQGDGSLTVIASSGTAPYSYAISGVTSNQSNGNFTNLFAGSYTAVITDANGCVIDSLFSISEPLDLAINISTSGSICSGSNGTVSISGVGGTTPYQYSNNNGISFQPSGVFNNLMAGTYPIMITDANGCSSSTIASVADSPGPILLAVSSTNATCNGYSDGTVVVSISGGTSPIEFQVNNGTSQTSPSFNALPAGSYNILVTDANGCTTTASSSITQPQPISISAAGSSQICIGGTANISASANGGNGGYVFTWNNGLIGANQAVSPSSTTIYTVSVTDSLGCPGASTSLNIGVYPPLQLVITPNDTICEGQSSTIVAQASGGDGGPYNYQWAGMAGTTNSQNVSPLVSTSYTVSVTDGCTTPMAVATSQVIVNPLPAVDFSLNPAQGCAPLTVDFTNISSAGNGSQFYWNFGDNNTSTAYSPTHVYTEPGTYSVTLKAITAAGCQRQVILPDTVHVWPVPVADIIATPPVASILYPVIQFRDGGVGANSWSWNFGDGSPLGSGQSTTHTYELPNTYDVTLYVMNQYGCRDTAYTRVTIENENTIYVPNAFTPNGDGTNDVFNVYGMGISSGTMNIFNRWGQMVYSTENLEKGWNGEDELSGKMCSIGVYVYRIDLATYSGAKRTLFGRVSLVE